MNTPLGRTARTAGPVGSKRPNVIPSCSPGCRAIRPINGPGAVLRFIETSTQTVGVVGEGRLGRDGWVGTDRSGRIGRDGRAERHGTEAFKAFHGRATAGHADPWFARRARHRELLGHA